MSAEVETTFRDAVTLNEVQALYAVDVAQRQAKVFDVTTWLAAGFAGAWLLQAACLRFWAGPERNTSRRQ